ncbi:MAG TPA: ABC transporter permease [Terriglobales bacterium]|nr:ABC transporter permease [Terriglobales bacterium]
MTDLAVSMPRAGRGKSLWWSSFIGLILRDVRVLRRDFIPFVIRTGMNPLLFVFVFTYVFPKIGQGFSSANGTSFGTVLLPGLISVSIMFQGIAAVAMPLSVEFSATGEIYDRVMSPLPVAGVAIEKVVFSALQSVLAAVIVFPMVVLIPSTPVHFAIHDWPLLVSVVILASLASGAMGLVIGTAIQPQQIGLIFGVVVVPVTFLGCVYYPWFLLHHVRWLQYLVLINPIVYMSEGLRAALTPDVPHMPVWAVLGALTLSTALLGWWGVRGFLKRVVS